MPWFHGDDCFRSYCTSEEEVFAPEEDFWRYDEEPSPISIELEPDPTTPEPESTFKPLLGKNIFYRLSHHRHQHIKSNPTHMSHTRQRPVEPPPPKKSSTANSKTPSANGTPINHKSP